MFLRLSVGGGRPNGVADQPGQAVTVRIQQAVTVRIQQAVTARMEINRLALLPDSGPLGA